MVEGLLSTGPTVSSYTLICYSGLFAMLNYLSEGQMYSSHRNSVGTYWETELISHSWPRSTDTPPVWEDTSDALTQIDTCHIF